MRRNAKVLACTAALAVGGGLPALTGVGTAAAPAGTAPMVVVHEGHVGADGTTTHAQREVSAQVRQTPQRDKADPASAAKPARLHPSVAAALRQPNAGNARQRLVVGFTEDVQVPRLPSPDTRSPRSSAVNQQAQARASQIIDEVRQRRQPGYDRRKTELARLGAQTEDTFWLVNAMVVELPLSAVPALLARPDVTYVEPVDNGARPPADADLLNDVDDARARMRTDPYFNLGQTTGYIGLLDTGVRASHSLFTNPSRLGIREDLTNTLNPNPDDDCWNHGTASAAILSGNGNLGGAFRGVTNVVVDSFKVYPSGCGGLDSAAAVRGFQRAVQVLDRVIVAEMQAGGNELSAISRAADAAYDAGAVVIAANGNNGSAAGTVNVPAVAQKALGVGAVDVKTMATPAYQSRGPAPDGRTKPDLQAPTNVETASSSGTTATRVFGGTSAATPHAAGAATLVRNFLRGSAFDIDPGSVYSYLLASGTASFPHSNTTGTGPVRLPVNSSFWRGTSAVSNGQTLDIPINVTATSNRMQVAIWWPEQPATHNDVDLSLVDPSGAVRASSVSAGGVFERVTVAGPLAGGTWKVRLRGYNVPSGSQRVHWTATTTS
jgi:hypothetical protein